MSKSYKFWHEYSEKCKEIYNSFCNDTDEYLEREVIAVLELNSVDIELQIERVGTATELTLFICSKDENGEWCSDDYLSDKDVTDIIAGFHSWDEIEGYLKDCLKTYCIKNGLDYTAEVEGE